jgi:hypothetical protein
MATATTYGFTDLRAGSIWEKYASSTVRDGELTGRYELVETLKVQSRSPGITCDSVVHLKNLETGGVAKVFSQALRQGPKRRPHGYWELVAD